jgi:hypothetical protein
MLSSPAEQVPQVQASFADPFSLTDRAVNDVLAQDHLVYDGQAQLDGRLCDRVHRWSVGRMPGQMSGAYADRLEWWIDAQTHLPVQLVENSPADGAISHFHFSELNQTMPDSAFQPPNPAAPRESDDGWYDKPLEPGEKRFIAVSDGCDGRMRARLGRIGPKGTVSSGMD